MGSTRLKVWEDVQEALVEASQLEAFISSCATDEKTEEEYVVRIDVERNEKLLERKGRKAEHGYEIAAEIRKLLDDSRKLKHV